MVELIELARQCEEAGAEQQGGLLETAWDAMFQNSATFRAYATARPSRGFDNFAGKFAIALDAMAYESAATMLVPEGCVTYLATQDRHTGRWQWSLRDKLANRHSCRAETAALALTAAALRALSDARDGQGEG